MCSPVCTLSFSKGPLPPSLLRLGVYQVMAPERCHCEHRKAGGGTALFALFPSPLGAGGKLSSHCQHKVSNINLTQLSYESWHDTNFAMCYHEMQKTSYMHINISHCTITGIIVCECAGPKLILCKLLGR